VWAVCAKRYAKEAGGLQRRIGQVLVPGLAALALVSGCSAGDDGDGRDGGGGGGGGREGGADGGVAPNRYVVSPLKNSDGTKPGLGPVTNDAGKAAARRLIDQLATKGRGPRTGYERD
jgi:hypothetical protein